MSTSLFVNGVSGLTGELLVPSLDVRRAAELARGRPADADLGRWLKEVWKKLTSKWLGLPLGVDPREPGKAGWGVVFHEAESAAVRAAVEPLIEHRRQRLGAAAVRVLDYRSGEEWRHWLARHGAEPGSVLPQRVPYYLLLVGAPTGIPYDLERLLAVEYAVGRLGFDAAAEYAQYAESLIRYETAAGAPTARRADFFAVRHAFDPVTQLTADRLARPLATGLPGRYGFSTRELRAESATKASLGEIFRPPQGTLPPAFLFTAAHGLGWPKGHPQQRGEQGALVCQDWPSAGAIDRRHYFSAADLPSDARVHGLIAFLFACYGAGTPQRDEYLVEPGKPPREIAERPFVAALPNALLAHPQGGALAVIGHVERAWTYSIVDDADREQLLPFENTLGGILLGWPVGHALSFRERYAALAAGLLKLHENARWGLAVADNELAAAWVESNDARNYAVLGDPAVRLRIEAMD